MSIPAKFPFGADYKLRLGGFIFQFSQMEVGFFYLLCKIIDLDANLGAALFSGTRLDGLIANIRRCYEAMDEKIDPDLERVLQQAAILNGARNDVVHLVPDWAKDEPRETEMTLTNRLRYLPQKAKDMVISLADLEAMEADTCGIENFLVRRIYPDIERPPPPTTWRYKPPSQASKDRKTPKRARKRAPPRQSSRG